MKVSQLRVLLVICVLSGKSQEQVLSEVAVPEGDAENILAGKLSEDESVITVSTGCPANPARPCVAKCCDLNETHANLLLNKTSSPCLPKYVDFWVELEDRPDYKNANLPVEDRYEYFIGDPCTTGRYILEPDIYNTDKYFLYSNGSISVNGVLYSMSDYCVDDVDGVNRAFICFEVTSPDDTDFYHILYPVGQIISIPFLLATAAMYLFVEQFRDVQGKVLVCYVSCLTIAFFFLALVQLSGPQLNQSFCTAVAFIMQFAFVGCFFWLNVLCYDSYRNFREMSNKDPPISERKLFIMYSFYAWFGPMIIFIVSLVIDMVPNLPDHFLRPQFGTQSCWFSSQTAALPYFFGPVGLLLAVNAIFFILTAYRNCYTEVNRFRGENEVRARNKYILYLRNAKQCFKTFLTMGLCWLAEVISWAIGGSRFIWITTDVINTLQGILIFYFYVWEPKRVREKLKDFVNKWKSIICKCGKRPEVHTVQQIHAGPEEVPLKRLSA